MDQSDIVNLRWNQHQATLMSVFDDLLDKEKLTDCTISAEGRHLRTHKIILSACSPYFEELFTENNEKDPIIILHDVKYETIKTLMDFMYRGEVNVPQMELRGVFNLSEYLQVRGLSGTGYVDNVSKQNISGINSPPAGPDDLLSQPASVSCFTTGQNEAEEKVQSFRVCSPTVSSQEGLSVRVDSLVKSIHKYGKGVNDFGSCETTDKPACQEFINPDCDSEHQLQSERQVLPTMCNLASGSVYNPNHFQSVCSKLEVAENQQCLIPEAVLPDKRSTNLSAHRQEVSVKTESEDLKNCSVIVEDLTLDDDDYCDDNVNSVQKSCGRNLRSSLETIPSQGISMKCFTKSQNNSEENMESFRRWSPTVSPQDGGRVQADSISKSLRKYRKSMNQYSIDQGRGQNTLEEVITSDLDSIHQLPSQRQVLPTTCDSRDGLVYSSSGQVTVAENEQFSMPEAVLTGGSSATLNSQQQEVKVETKSEINENNIEIVEDLTLDDDNYSSSGEYNSLEIDNREASNPNAGLTNEETVHIQGSNNQHSPTARGYLNNMTLITSQSVLHNQFSCQSCGKPYQYLTSLQRHMKYKCGKERQFQCPHCSNQFARNDVLQRHMKYQCFKEQRFQCPHCSKQFARRDLLQRHMKYQCGKERRFQCPHCSKLFARRDLLQRHMKYQCGKEPQFQCPHCRVRFGRSDHLKQHMASRRCRL